VAFNSYFLPELPVQQLLESVENKTIRATSCFEAGDNKYLPLPFVLFLRRLLLPGVRCLLPCTRFCS
jgi:hypothetical protein